MDDLPAYRDLPRVAGEPASWGLWGDAAEDGAGDGRSDLFGCLNLLTPARVAGAASLVRDGSVFALNWSMDLPDPPLFGRPRWRHEVTGDERSLDHDDVLDRWNTQSSSQWDGFRHFRHPALQRAEHGTGHYGAVPDGDHGVHHWAARGIAGRGIVCDVGRFRAAQGRPLRYRERDVIEADEVLACLAAQGTEARPGDVLLLRTGWVGWYERLPRAEREELAGPGGLAAPGLAASERTAELLWDLHVAAVGADNPAVEAWPVEGEFLHLRLLPLLGIPLGELWDLEALAADCARDGRYECLFVSAPLRLPAGVASPPNALALK